MSEYSSRREGLCYGLQNPGYLHDEGFCRDLLRAQRHGELLETNGKPTDVHRCIYQLTSETMKSTLFLVMICANPTAAKVSCLDSKIITIDMLNFDLTRISYGLEWKSLVSRNEMSYVHDDSHLR